MSIRDLFTGTYLTGLGRISPSDFGTINGLYDQIQNASTGDVISVDANKNLVCSTITPSGTLVSGSNINIVSNANSHTISTVENPIFNQLSVSSGVTAESINLTNNLVVGNLTYPNSSTGVVNGDVLSFDNGNIIFSTPSSSGTIQGTDNEIIVTQNGNDSIISIANPLILNQIESSQLLVGDLQYPNTSLNLNNNDVLTFQNGAIEFLPPQTQNLNITGTNNIDVVQNGDDVTISLNNLINLNNTINIDAITGPLVTIIETDNSNKSLIAPDSITIQSLENTSVTTFSQLTSDNIILKNSISNTQSSIDSNIGISSFQIRVTEPITNNIMYVLPTTQPSPNQILSAVTQTELGWVTLDPNQGIQGIQSTDLDVTLNSGIATINLNLQSGVLANQYTNPILTVNDKGIITDISSGTDGGITALNSGNSNIVCDVLNETGTITLADDLTGIHSISLNQLTIEQNYLVTQSGAYATTINNNNITLTDGTNNALITPSNINIEQVDTNILNIKTSDFSTILYSFPITQPQNNQILISNGSAQLNWVDNTDGGITTINSSNLNVSTVGNTSTINLETQSGFTPGSFTNCNLTVNSNGIITDISSGSDGGITNIFGGNNMIVNVQGETADINLVNDVVITSTLKINSTANETYQLPLGLTDMMNGGTAQQGDLLALDLTANPPRFRIDPIGNNGITNITGTSNEIVVNTPSQGVRNISLTAPCNFPGDVVVPQGHTLSLGVGAAGTGFILPNTRATVNNQILSCSTGGNCSWITPAYENAITDVLGTANQIDVSINNGVATISLDSNINTTRIIVNDLVVGDNGISYEFPASIGTVGQKLAVSSTNGQLEFISDTGVTGTVNQINVANDVVSLSATIELPGNIVANNPGSGTGSEFNSDYIYNDSPTGNVELSNGTVKITPTGGTSYYLPITTGAEGSIISMGANGQAVWTSSSGGIQSISNTDNNLQITGIANTVINLASNVSLANATGTSSISGTSMSYTPVAIGMHQTVINENGLYSDYITGAQLKVLPSTGYQYVFPTNQPTYGDTIMYINQNTCEWTAGANGATTTQNIVFNFNGSTTDPLSTNVTIKGIIGSKNFILGLGQQRLQCSVGNGSMIVSNSVSIPGLEPSTVGSQFLCNLTAYRYSDDTSSWGGTLVDCMLFCKQGDLIGDIIFYIVRQDNTDFAQGYWWGFSHPSVSDQAGITGTYI